MVSGPITWLATDPDVEDRGLLDRRGGLGLVPRSGFGRRRLCGGHRNRARSLHQNDVGDVLAASVVCFENDPRENRTLCLYFYEMIISLVITGVYEALKEVKRRHE